MDRQVGKFGHDAGVNLTLDPEDSAYCKYSVPITTLGH